MAIFVRVINETGGKDKGGGNIAKKYEERSGHGSLA